MTKNLKSAFCPRSRLTHATKSQSASQVVLCAVIALSPATLVYQPIALNSAPLHSGMNESSNMKDRLLSESGPFQIRTQSAKASSEMAQAAQATAGNNLGTKSRFGRLMVIAAKEKNPAKALEILAQARLELKRENLSSEKTNQLNAAIDLLEQSLKRRLPPPSSQTPSSGATGVGGQNPTLSGSLPPVVNLSSQIGTDGNSNHTNSANQDLPATEVERVLRENPDVRDVLFEVSQGRLERDASNLDAIIKERTGMSPIEHDEAEAIALAMGNQPGPFLQLLEKLNLMKLDTAEENLRLRREFDGVSIDTLAEKLIRDATQYSIPAGVIQGVLADVGMAGRFLGISSEVLMTFVINANLVLRISDLYGIEMNNSEKEIVLLVVFSAAKTASQYGLKQATTTGMLSGFGSRLAQLKYVKKPGEFVGFLKNFLAQPAIAKAAGPVAHEMLSAAPTSDAKNVQNGVIKKMAARINFASLIKGTLHGARSGAETYLIGRVAMMIFKSAHETKRAIHNDNFRRFLMTTSGEGFLKLMVLAMHDGKASSFDSKQISEMATKTRFIENLARAAKACSPEDIAQLEYNPQSAFPAYACARNSSTARFDRLKAEMLTFDEIPNEYVSGLRIASREHRQRMAELIMQMQFLDGDRQPSEVRFFKTTIATTLGITAPEDVSYFDRFHAFIVERGGMEASETVPGGYRIRDVNPASPYNMVDGFTRSDSPHSPPDRKQSESQPSKRVRPPTNGNSD